MNKRYVPPYVIFEVANVHAGNVNYLGRMIDAFSRVEYENKGIKFQIFSPDGIALPDFEWYPVYKELCFDRSVWKNMINETAKYGDAWVDIFDGYGAIVLQENIDHIVGIKLQASVLENHEIRSVLEQVEFGDRRLIINVSGLALDEVHAVYDYFSGIAENVILQIGYQSYPTKISNTGLQKIPVLHAAFPGVPLCMADHADANENFALEVPIYAAVLGCSYIEKHFCLDRKMAKYDGFSSLEPDQMRSLCASLKNASLASHGLFVSDDEKEYLRKSIQIPIARHAMNSGDLISKSDIIFRRTKQSGLSFREIQDIQNQKHLLAMSPAANASFHRENFRPANIAVIAACRMKSSRLQQKALLPIVGVPSVDRCLSQCLAIPAVHRVVLATSDLEADAVLRNHTLNGAVNFWQGEPDDVISRYLGACEHFNIDVVVRVTADCPLILPEIITYLLEQHFLSGADYTAARNAAVGTAGEIINVRALKKVRDYFGAAEYSEYMTWYFQNNPGHFKINLVQLPPSLVRDYRMTLDYQEDLKMFNRLYEKLNNEKSFYSADEVFAVLDGNPEISKINGHLTLKYKTDKDLIETLNRETRMEAV